MKVPIYRPPQREEIPTLPKGLEWTDQLLAARDKALKEHTRALQSRLSFEDNFNAEVRELSLKDDTEVDVHLKTLKGPPLGVLLIQSALYDYAHVAWEHADVDKITVKVKWDSSPTGFVDVTLLILGS